MTDAIGSPRPPAADEPMRHADFRIGGSFWSDGQEWRCTDIGARVITAIRLDHPEDPSWYNGPPYGVAESVFDEYDIEGCTREPQADAAEPHRHPPGASLPEPASEWDDPKAAARVTSEFAPAPSRRMYPRL